MADDLDAILRHAGLGGTELRRRDAEELARSVSHHPPEEFITPLVLAPALEWDDGESRPRDFLELHTGRWRLGLENAGNRRHLVIVTVAAVLVDAAGLTERTVWVAGVLPAVLDVIAVRAEPGGLRVELARRPEPQLPEHLVRTVNALDFQDFVAAVRRAGPSLTIPAGGTITLSGAAG